VNEGLRLVCRDFGPPPVLGLDTVERPRAGRGEALIEVAFVALNFFGTLIVQGKCQTRPAPLTLALVKGVDWLGVEWAKFASREPQANRGNLSQVSQCAAAGKLDTYIHAIHKISDFARAFAEIVERRAQGKVLLRME
jgi:NADPH:quinone reductase-like Zn-dependent oxidoreductase